MDILQRLQNIAQSIKQQAENASSAFQELFTSYEEETNGIIDVKDGTQTSVENLESLKHKVNAMQEHANQESSDEAEDLKETLEQAKRDLDELIMQAKTQD